MHRTFICSHTKGNKLRVHCKMQPEVCRGTPKERHLNRKNLLVQMFQLVFPCSKSGGKVHKELLAVHHWFTSFEEQHYYICTTTNKRQVVSRHDKLEENSLKINCI